MHVRKATPALSGQRRSLSWPQHPGRPAPSSNNSVETTASKSSTRTNRGCHIHHLHQHRVWGAAVAPSSAKATKALSQPRSYSAGAVASPQSHHFKGGKQKCSFKAGKQKEQRIDSSTTAASRRKFSPAERQCLREGSRSQSTANYGVSRKGTSGHTR